MSCDVHTHDEPACAKCFESLMVDYEVSEQDNEALTQALDDARERAQDLAIQCALDERARIVAYLRSEPTAMVCDLTGHERAAIADALERGEHLK